MDSNELIRKLKSDFDNWKSERGVEFTALQKQVDTIDSLVSSGGRIMPDRREPKGLGSLFTESKEFLEAQSAGFGRKAIRLDLKSSAFETKTNISDANLGGGTSGVLMPQRLQGVVIMPQQSLRIRDVMNVVPQNTGNSFDFVKQSTRTNNASPQVEADPKSQSYYNWNTASGTISTVAHWVKVTRQALDDVPWLAAQINSELTYGLKVKEEAEILSGDGTGVHLNGLITQATPFNTALLSATQGWQRLDILRFAKLQVRLAGLATYAPTAFVLNPSDIAQIELTKDGFGHYLVGDPQTGVQVRMIWGLPTVESDSIAAGSFLVGAFATGATLIDRQQSTVEIAYQNDTDFISNLATVLCEERIGLAVKRADCFVHGSFSTSPA